MKLLSLLLILTIIIPAYSKVTSVRPHVTKKGTYVKPHARTAPNKTRVDNWSSKGNVNPTTGKRGTVDPYKPKRSARTR
jgi:hypothetical protein